MVLLSHWAKTTLLLVFSKIVLKKFLKLLQTYKMRNWEGSSITTQFCLTNKWNASSNSLKFLTICSFVLSLMSEFIFYFKFFLLFLLIQLLRFKKPCLDFSISNNNNEVIRGENYNYLISLNLQVKVLLWLKTYRIWHTGHIDYFYDVWMVYL